MYTFINIIKGKDCSSLLENSHYNKSADLNSNNNNK